MSSKNTYTDNDKIFFFSLSRSQEMKMRQCLGNKKFDYSFTTKTLLTISRSNWNYIYAHYAVSI